MTWCDHSDDMTYLSCVLYTLYMSIMETAAVILAVVMYLWWIVFMNLSIKTTFIDAHFMCTLFVFLKKSPHHTAHRENVLYTNQHLSMYFYRTLMRDECSIQRKFRVDCVY